MTSTFYTVMTDDKNNNGVCKWAMVSDGVLGG
jgi:hypothetical protein